jgi:predicted ATPase
MRSTGFRTGWPYYLAMMAKACARQGDVDEALGLQAEAIKVGHETGEHCWDAELCRIEGELLLQQVVPDHAQAEASFRRAIEVARRAHTKSWELRAVTSLTRLLREGDHRAEGRRLLADVYGWFTEGFETHDLREARALLDSLGERA